MTECPICFDDTTPKSIVMMKPCGHYFCYECVREWNDQGNQTCPMCREVTLSVTERTVPERNEYISEKVSASVCLITAMLFCLIH